MLKRREDFDAEIDRVRRDLREQERRLEKRADMLDQKLELINTKEVELATAGDRWPTSSEELRQRQAEVKQTLADQLENLQRICRLSSEDAREMLLKRSRGRAEPRGWQPDPEAPGARSKRPASRNAARS